MNTQLFIVPQLLEGVGPINAATKKMAERMSTNDPREVFRRINSGEWVVSASTTRPIEMPVWKTIKLGTCKTPYAYRRALKEAGMLIGDWGDMMLRLVTCSKEEIDLDLVVLSVGDLGFKNGARYDEICDKAVELGLELCPAEVGPALRLRCSGQPREWLRVAMKAIIVRGSELGIFGVCRDAIGLWLHGNRGNPDFVWYTDHRFVFCRGSTMGYVPLVC